MEENIDKNTSLARAENIINRHIIWAMASGAIPIPFVDAIGVMFIQNDMIKQLSKIYGFDYNENIGKSIVASIIASSTAKGVSMIFKPIKAADRIMMSVVSGAFTYAIGRIFLSNFEQGIALIDIDLEKGEELFDEFFEQGKDMLKNSKIRKSKRTKAERKQARQEKREIKKENKKIKSDE